MLNETQLTGVAPDQGRHSRKRAAPTPMPDEVNSRNFVNLQFSCVRRRVVPRKRAAQATTRSRAVKIRLCRRHIDHLLWPPSKIKYDVQHYLAFRWKEKAASMYIKSTKHAAYSKTNTKRHKVNVSAQRRVARLFGWTSPSIITAALPRHPASTEASQQQQQHHHNSNAATAVAVVDRREERRKKKEERRNKGSRATGTRRHTGMTHATTRSTGRV